MDWHVSSKGKDWPIYICGVFFGLPMFYSVVFFVFVVLFQDSLKRLESKSYLEQIVIVFGAIVIYFAARINLDGNQKKKREKDAIIESQKIRIYELESEISRIK